MSAKIGMKPVRACFWIVCWLMGMATTVCAQPKRHLFNQVNTSQGLSHNQVNAIFQDDRGFIWFGTMAGLNRYDGYGFKLFQHDLNDTTSLSDNYVQQILEAPHNKIWIGTTGGVNLYDPLTERFDRHPERFLASLGIPNGSINEIHKDRHGRFWFVHAQQGLFRYDPARQQTRHVIATSPEAPSQTLQHLAEDQEGNLWVIHADGLLEKIDGQTLSVIQRNTQLCRYFGGELLTYTLYADTDNDLWILPTYTPRGVLYFNTTDQTIRPLHENTPATPLSTNVVRVITQDDEGVIWIGTDHGGINLIDKSDFSIQYLWNTEGDPKSLAQNSINTFYKDHSGIIWVGTFKKGVSYYHQRLGKFQLITHQVGNPASLPYDDINHFAEDAQGNLWIGTNGGGLIYYDRKRERFTQFQHDPNDPYSLSSNIIVSLMIDHRERLWIGTYFGGLNCFDGKRFIRYQHDASDPYSLADDRVWEIYEDRDHQLWVGTLGGGLDRFDPQTARFIHHRNHQPNGISSDYISAIAEDQQGDLWLSTAFGVSVLPHAIREKRPPAIHEAGVSESSVEFQKYYHPNNSPSSNNNVSILRDHRGRMWVGSREGLNVFDDELHLLRTFRKEDGLVDNAILSIQEDTLHDLWVSTPNGISHLQLGQDSLIAQITNFDESDGLQGRAFNENAGFTTSRGELLFGGADGFNIIQPPVLAPPAEQPPVVLTHFSIFNREVGIGEAPHDRPVLSRSITETKKLTLTHRDNVFSFEFAALSYYHPERNRYAYKLEGFNDDWLLTDGKTRRATYTNLDPGEYTFRVKAANGDGTWNEDGVRLALTILPPFWKTKAAYVIYFILLAAVLVLARYMTLKRERFRVSLEHERREARRQHEMDLMKIRFFTNVSHEFRTPLSLILTPIEKMTREARDPDQQRHLQLVQRNARRLLTMVNQLLDFRKLEEQEVALHANQADIIAFLEDVTENFADLSDQKHIGFSFSSAVEKLDMLFDGEKLEKILFNLLSNAFKFTPAYGKVEVSVATRKVADAAWLDIHISDSGIGIPPEKQEKIFERFFQQELPPHLSNQGSGIGLAITQEFVRLHHGHIAVQSEPEKGSCFTVSLPIRTQEADALVRHTSPQPVQLLSPSADTLPHAGAKPANGTRKPTVLLIEDHEDFRFYLKDNLKAHFHILEASNGRKGWEMLQETTPDLVVSDVMMPELDGIELCKKLKHTPQTAHIPVILLTARATDAQRLEGYEVGANDYITKPFNFEILLSRIRNLLGQQRAQREAFSKRIAVQPSEVEVLSLDERLVQKALSLVEQHLADPDFTVEQLSQELGMSRVHFYKKITSLTNQTPLEFIRTVRLRRAQQLLRDSQLTVAEVAYRVGFNNPKNFSRYFKQEFGVLPSQYATQTADS